MSDNVRAESVSPMPRGGTCPICDRPSDPVLRPFCSKRCADVDLHRWLSGTYRVPAEDEPDDDEGLPPLGDEPVQ